MIDQLRLARAADHFATWLAVGDDRERVAGVDEFAAAVRGASIDEINRALPGFCEVVNACIGITNGAVH